MRAPLLLRIAVLAGSLGLAQSASAMFEGRFLYFPSHARVATPLREWRVGKELFGYTRPREEPRMAWLVCHGNAGQAAQRAYVCPCLPPTDAVYILEYPGYGDRPGSPSMRALNAAAAAALAAVRRAHPGVPVGVLGESLGSGPASFLCSQAAPPDRVVLVVPFDNLLSVAREHLGWLPVSFLLRDKWDNAAALSGYRGRIDIFAAAGDQVIPVKHAQRLAAALPRAVYHELRCGHNDWSAPGLVQIEP